MHPTHNTLSENIRAQSVELLNKHLAAAIDLQAQMKQAHWNVRGPGFIAIHTLFDQVAAKAAGYADLIAERAGGLGGTAEGTVHIAAERTFLLRYPLGVAKEAEHERLNADKLQRHHAQSARHSRTFAMKNLVRSLLIAPLALWVVAPAMAGLAPSAARPAVQVQVAEASTSPADHNAYAQKAHEEVQSWRTRLDTFGVSVKADAKQARQAATEDLNAAWVKANDASARLETAGAADWESAKVSFRKASDELAATWTKVRADVK